MDLHFHIFTHKLSRLLTGGVGGTEPEDWQVSAQVLYLVAEEGRVREGSVSCHPDQIILKFGWHHLVLLQGGGAERVRRSETNITTKHLNMSPAAEGAKSHLFMDLVTSCPL